MALNNQTTYCSPIKLLSLTAEETAKISMDDLRNAMARLESGTETEIAPNLQNINATTWGFHRTIYEQPGLLQFLEDGTFDEDKLSKAAYLRYNPSFVQFISLPFAAAFRKASEEALQKNDDYRTVQQLLQYSSFILPAHETIAFESFNQYLESLVRLLAPLSWEQFTEDESVLDFIFSSQWLAFVNNLPPVCKEQRNRVGDALLQILKRFRLDASPAYLKAFCAKLRQLKMEPALQQSLQEYESSFRLPAPIEEPAQASTSHHWIYYLGGALLIVVVGLFLLLRPKHDQQRPPQPEDRYMDAVETTSASDQLSSSINEKNLKGFFYLSSRQENEGTRLALQTGVTPIPGVTKLPKEDGNSTMTIRNQTSADALLLYFGSDNPLVGKQSRLVAIYIKSGEEYNFRFQPDFGRFNFVFGKEWVHLASPVPFPFYQGEQMTNPAANSKNLLRKAWLIKDFFRRVLRSQPLLNHDLTITNVEQQTESQNNTPVYTLLNKKMGTKRYSDSGDVALDLEEANGEIMVKAQSSLYVYLSPETFNPKELR